MNYICFAVSLRGVDATQRFKQVSNISDIKTEKKGNDMVLIFLKMLLFYGTNKHDNYTEARNGNNIYTSILR